MQWLNQDSREFLRNGYLLEGVEPEERIRQIADRAEEILGIDGFADKFYEHMSRGWYSLASPIWANLGLSRGLPISCYGSFVDDSMIGILDTAREVGMMSKYGGGTSGYFGNVRGRGAPITNNGFSEGSVNFMRLFNTMIDVTKQGGTRRGSFAAYLPIDHPDIDEFLAIKTEGNPIQGIFTGVNVSDEWMESMIAGDGDKRSTWAKVLRMRSEIGLPYIFFTDNVNNNSPDVYQDKGLEIKASNLCVTGDQRVVSNRGLLTAKELYEQGGNLQLFDNEKVVSSSPMRLIEKDAHVWTIELENGLTHTITQEHKVLTKRGCIELRHLTEHDWVAVQTNAAFDISGDDLVSKFAMGLNSEPFSKINKIYYSGREDVYCVSVDSEEHLWVCNGVVTHNCSEIALSSDEENSFVCDLSSMNVAKYDEWKDTDAVEVLIYFLDAVMTEFIEKAAEIPGYEKAVNFAKQQRALGLGVLGWHDYLQSKSIAFDSYAAMRENNAIFKTISERALSASQELAELYGEPELLKGYGRRNTTLMAIAPTTSSAFILGQTSQSIEPYRSNYFVKDLAKKKVTIRNRNLEKVLEEKGCNDDETWMSILENGGSVQHLDCLSDHEKEVFKTFSEISQLAVVQQAAQRQKYIDQSQSLNLMIHPDTPLKDINSLHIEAWKLGVKTLYYQHSVNAAQEFNKDLLTCSACES